MPAGHDDLSQDGLSLKVRPVWFRQCSPCQIVCLAYVMLATDNALPVREFDFCQTAKMPQSLSLLLPSRLIFLPYLPEFSFGSGFRV